MFSHSAAIGAALHPSADSQRRLIPETDDGDMRMDSDLVSAGLFYVNALASAQGRIGAEAVPWHSIRETVVAMARQCASTIAKRARGVMQASHAHSAVPYGVTLPHVGPSANGHTVCALYSYPARTVVIYDSMIKPPSRSTYKVRLSARRAFGGLDMCGSRMHPNDRSVAWRIIAWLTVCAASRTVSTRRGRDDMTASIVDALSGTTMARGFSTWRVEVRSMGQLQVAEDCGPMAMAMAWSLLAVTLGARAEDLHVPMFYTHGDMAKPRRPAPLTAEGLLMKKDPSKYTGPTKRAYMVAPQSRTRIEHADNVRAALSIVFQRSASSGEDIIAAHEPFYTLRTVVEEVLQRHVLQAQARPAYGGASRVFYASDVLESTAERLGTTMCARARFCGAHWWAKDAFSLERSIGPGDSRLDVAICLDSVAWGERPPTRGRDRLQSPALSTAHTVINAVLHTDVPPAFFDEHLPRSLAPRQDHFWEVHVASRLTHESSLSTGTQVRSLRPGPPLRGEAEASVWREGDVLRARYCSLGGLSDPPQ